MTEEIIIDGVNVAGCEHYTTMEDCDGIHDLCEQLDDYCSTKKNCYYKQLKRLEQDSKQLTQWLDEARRNADFWCDKCTSLEQENKELKKQIESQKGLITVGGKQQYKYLQEIDKLQQENKELKEFKKEVLKPVFLPNIEEEVTNTYRSALEEILESAKFAQCLPCGSGNLEDCINCNDDTTNNGQFCMEKRIHEIKTKCVEVLKYSEE